jgi:hypothetical protein
MIKWIADGSIITVNSFDIFHLAIVCGRYDAWYLPQNNDICEVFAIDMRGRKVCGAFFNTVQTWRCDCNHIACSLSFAMCLRCEGFMNKNIRLRGICVPANFVYALWIWPHGSHYDWLGQSYSPRTGQSFSYGVCGRPPPPPPPAEGDCPTPDKATAPYVLNK